MSFKDDKIKGWLNFHKESAHYDLNHFKEFLSLVIILNNWGVLKENDFVHQIVDLIEVDELFNDRLLNYEKERLLSHTSFDKKSNLLYNKIEKLALEEFIDENDYSINELTGDEIEKLRLEYYHDNVLNALIELTNVINRISIEYDLKNIDTRIVQGDSILYDSKIRIYSPLLLSQEQWEKVIIHELMLSNSLEEVGQKKNRVAVNLTELEELLPYSLKNLPLVHIGDPPDQWLYYWDKHKALFICPIHFWIGMKKHFLESLGSNKLKRLYNRELIKRYKTAKKTVKTIENQLRRNKIEVKNKRYLKSITRGIIYLLRKENPSLSNSKLSQIANKIIGNLFSYDGTKFEESIIDASIKISNTVLIEFILFIRNEKKFLVNKKLSIPRLISDNLNYDSKGFSYPNLNKIYRAIEVKGEFNFSGITSTNALSNEMKMRNS